ncbi:basic leucine zipper 19 isoform X1 [Iris pallida]|uniref:Basic leucine zipper 19 isoform X1 n=1 Tax=Iris pallida TaxID=29817 RepID=A0AAX6HL36_IRIPA|nr:basic leucine zipper 19 isoform X1 [Iris pallida]
MSDPEVTALLESIPRDSLQYVALEYPNQDATSQSNMRR